MGKKKSNKKSKSKNKPVPKGAGFFIRSWWSEKKPVFRFTFTFFLVMILFYLFWSTPLYRDSILKPWIHFNAWLAAGVLDLFGFQASANETLLSGIGFSLDIKQGCDAIEPTMLLVAGFLATPLRWTNKWKALILGVIFMLSLNFIRIISLALTERYWKSGFEFMHVDFWQAFFILLAIAWWANWLSRILKRSKSHGSDSKTT